MSAGTASDVTLLPAVRQLELLRQNRISAPELAEEHIRAIDRLNPTLRALVDFDAERVRAQSRSVGAGPLAGLCMTVKSSIAVAGHRCEIGSTLHRGHTPAEDAEAVRRMRAAGAIVLGTTNCPELLMAYETGNDLHGETVNPWNPEYNAGGSSGGEAAAIAAGLSAGGLGSDSGGSVRQPAAFNGICALKPTPGRIPGRGHMPPNLGPFASLGAVGPMARTVDDLSLFFHTLAGHDPLDPVSAPVPLRSVPLDTAKQVPVGWFVDDGLIPVTPETRQAVENAAAALSQQGFTLRPFRPSLLEEARKLWYLFFVQCGEMFYEAAIAGRESVLSPTFRGFLALARRETPLTARTLLDAWAQADTVRQHALEEMRETPLLLCPVSAVPGFRFGERAWPIDGQAVGYLDAMRYTQWFNLLAVPAAVVPVGRSLEGLPIGVQLAGRPFNDELVLRVAAALDAEFGYRPPTLVQESAKDTVSAV